MDGVSGGTDGSLRFPAEAPAGLDGAALCVLASGSGGNCSVLSITRNGVRRLCLIDLGLSPRRTVKILADLGLRLDQIDDVILTHLDSDHFYEGWVAKLPRHVSLRVHARHAESCELFGLFGVPVSTFETDFRLRDGTLVRSVLGSHDDLGVASFRFEMGRTTHNGVASLGFATDLGRATDGLIEHMRGVDVLAIESNYCPVMQRESGRPLYLQRRIMGGSGHLSNHEAVEAIARIAPREHVVLLHLSRQCNDPALVARLHEGCDYGLTITDQFEPTAWVPVGSGGSAGGAAAADATGLNGTARCQ